MEMNRKRNISLSRCSACYFNVYFIV